MSLQVISESEETDDINKYITFEIKGNDYGINILFVRDIIGLQRIMEVPDLPEYIKGIINLRGKIIPVMDVRERFGLELKDYHDRTCIIVIVVSDIHIGLIVDEVQEVIDININDIEPAITLNKKSSSSFISGLAKIGDRVKILLDVERLIDKKFEFIADLEEELNKNQELFEEKKKINDDVSD
jgi:purine-binding chemotaxis protein CheW